MEELKISTAQFENRSGDKEFNLRKIEMLAQQAAKDGSRVIAFHECSVTGYTFARHLSGEEMLDISEPVPGGKSILRLQEIAAKLDISILAGLFERDDENRIF